MKAFLVLIVLILLGFVGYTYFNQPQTLAERAENTVSELTQGNVAEAVDEAQNATKGEKLVEDLQDTTATASPTTH